MAFGGKKPGAKGPALVISVGPSKGHSEPPAMPSAMEDDDTESMDPGIEASKAFIAAVKSGSPEGVWEAFQELLANADSEGDAMEEPTDDFAPGEGEI
jgi:hypothetical protein